MADKEYDYKLEDLLLKKQIIIAKAIEVKQNKKEVIILEKKPELYMDDFMDHPLQAKVFLVGKDTTEVFGKEIKKGDIVYFDKPLNPQYDFINIKGEIYAKIFLSNIFMVRTPNK